MCVCVWRGVGRRGESVVASEGKTKTKESWRCSSYSDRYCFKHLSGFHNEAGRRENDERDWTEDGGGNSKADETDSSCTTI